MGKKSDVDQKIARFRKLQKILTRNIRKNLGIIIVDATTGELACKGFEESIVDNYRLIYKINYMLYLLGDRLGESIPVITDEEFDAAIKKSLLISTYI